MAASNSSTSDVDTPVDPEKQSLPVESGALASPREVEEAAHPSNAVVEKDVEAGADDQWTVEPEPEILDPEASGVTGVVGRVLSRISTKSNWNPGPPPDGGRHAWLMCICAHLVIANTWGVINSFGVFQAYYQTALDRPSSDVSWIGSIQVFLTFFIGTFTGRITDAGFFKPVLVVGICFEILSIFTTSVTTQYWQLILSQGICAGIGNGLLFTPAISTVSTYFSSKRSMAIGLSACGSVTGSLIYPAMARQLLPSVGYGWAIRAMGFVQVGSLAFAACFLKSRLPPRRSGSIVEWGAFKELEYTYYALGMFFNFWGVYFGAFYIAAFSRDQLTPPLSFVDSLNLLLVLNGIGVVGRTIPNWFADRFGPVNMLIPQCLISAILLFVWTVVDTPAGLYGWACIFGITVGAVQSLFPAALSTLTTDLRKQGTRMGMVFTIVSFAVLTGNPIAGAIITSQGGTYKGAQIFTGLSMILGSALLFMARVSKQRRTGAGWNVKM